MPEKLGKNFKKILINAGINEINFEELIKGRKENEITHTRTHAHTNKRKKRRRNRKKFYEEVIATEKKNYYYYYHYYYYYFNLKKKKKK